MSRPQKQPSAKKIELLNAYILEDLHGDPHKVKFTAAARYAREHGVDIMEYDFRRDEEVMQYLQRLQEGEPIRVGDTELLPPYTPLGKDIFSSGRRMSMEFAQKTIHDLDIQCSRYSMKTCELQGKISDLENENQLLKQEQILREQHSTATVTADSALLEERNLLREANTSLQKFITNSVMHDIALCLLEERHISAGTVCFLNREAFARMSVDIPESIPGFEDAPGMDSPLSEVNLSVQSSASVNNDTESSTKNRKSRSKSCLMDDDVDQISFDEILQQMRELSSLSMHCEGVEEATK